MTDRDFTQPSEHEQRVTQEREERTEQTPDDVTGEAPGEVGTSSYEAEVEAEKRGTTVGEVEHEVGQDEATPLDSAYKPRTG